MERMKDEQDRLHRFILHPFENSFILIRMNKAATFPVHPSSF